MRAVFEELYNASRTRRSPYMVPEYLRDDPMRARSQYAFQRGLWGYRLPSPALRRNMLCHLGRK